MPSIISDSDLLIIILNEKSDLSSFNCANSELNGFLKEDALSDQRNLISKTSLCFWKGELVGYIALATDTLEAKAVYIADGVEQYKYAKYPSIKIARLAVDSRFEKRGIGTHLLYAAIGKTLSICKSVGCRYILVDSKPEAIDFYKKYGFQEIEKNKKKNFIPMYLNMQPIVAKINPEDI